MTVNLSPETESRLRELVASTGRPAEELVEDAMAGYLAELSEVREMLDKRFDDLTTKRMNSIDGEDALRRLRQKSR